MRKNLIINYMLKKEYNITHYLHIYMSIKKKNGGHKNISNYLDSFYIKHIKIEFLFFSIYIL